MYEVVELADGSWYCYGRVQDGTEDWKPNPPTLDGAIKSMISFARVSNGSYIKKKDITVTRYQKPPDRVVSEEDWKLLQDIKRGALVALDHTDKRIRCNIDDDDCDLIVAIREGRVKTRYL